MLGPADYQDCAASRDSKHFPSDECLARAWCLSVVHLWNDDRFLASDSGEWSDTAAYPDDFGPKAALRLIPPFAIPD